MHPFFHYTIALLIAVTTCIAGPNAATQTGTKVAPSPLSASNKSAFEDGSIQQLVLLPAEGERPARIGIMTAVNERVVSPATHLAAFDTAKLVNEPGYLSLSIPESSTGIEATGMDQVAVFRFTFPKSDYSHVLMDISRGSPDFVGGELHMRDAQTFEGYGRFRDGSGEEHTIYCSFHFSIPFRQRGIWTGDKVEERDHAKVEGSQAFGAYSYFWTKYDAQSILMKVGISDKDLPTARANVLSRFPGWDFIALVEANRN